MLTASPQAMTVEPSFSWMSKAIAEESLPMLPLTTESTRPPFSLSLFAMSAMRARAMKAMEPAER